MSIVKPNLAGPNKVGTNGELSHPLVNLLLQLVDAVNANAGTDTTVTDDLQTQITAITTGIAAMHGTNGVNVWGSLESGLNIEGNADQQILAGQIFGD